MNRDKLIGEMIKEADAYANQYQLGVIKSIAHISYMRGYLDCLETLLDETPG